MLLMMETELTEADDGDATDRGCVGGAASWTRLRKTTSMLRAVMIPMASTGEDAVEML